MNRKVLALAKVFAPLQGLAERWQLMNQGTPTDAPNIAVTAEEGQDSETIAFVRPYTMTSPERIRALCSAVRYVEDAAIDGAIVECGVWRGGSMMAVARTLMRRGAASRELYLFDTFEGMTEPGPQDVSLAGESARKLLMQSSKTEHDMVWCYAPIERVAQALSLTQYPEGRIHLIPGRVEETLAQSAPDRIAILRLDTDWYQSTQHEMEVLYPRMSRGGVLIVDDYGHWQGARRAIDEYITKYGIRMLLHPIDYTGRIGVKVFE